MSFFSPLLRGRCSQGQKRTWELSAKEILNHQGFPQGKCSSGQRRVRRMSASAAEMRRDWGQVVMWEEGEISPSVLPTSGPWDPFPGRSREWDLVPFASCFPLCHRVPWGAGPWTREGTSVCTISSSRAGPRTGLELSTTSAWQTHSGPYSWRTLGKSV